MSAMQSRPLRRWITWPGRVMRGLAARVRRAGWRAGLVGLFALGLAVGFAAIRLAGNLAVPDLAEPVGMAPAQAPGAPRPAPSGAPQAAPQTAAPAPAVEAPGSLPPPAARQALAAPAPGSFQWPADGIIVSSVGWRRHPQRGDWSYQPGLELAVGGRAPVRAAADGQVQEVALEAEGYVVTVEHGGGWVTRYSRLGAVSVSPGSQVRRGATVGYGPPAPDPVLPAMGRLEGALAADGPSWAGTGGLAVVGFEVRRGGEAVDPLRVMEPGGFRVTGPEDAPGGTAAATGAALPVPGP